MRIENFLKNLSQEELVEVQSITDKLITGEGKGQTETITVINDLIKTLVDIKSMGIELTMLGMITMLENKIGDLEKGD
jgi:hypothetical protein